MKKLVFGMLGLLVVGILAGYGVGWYVKRSQPPVERIPIVVEPEVPPREVQLYFSDPSGQYLQAETRQIDGCDDDRDCIRALITALGSGSRQGGLAVLPREAKVLGVELENDLARIDFSRQLVDYHPGGSLSELLTVYALANSLVENFSYIRQVQILVEGEPRETLKGHVRIDLPIYADFAYSHPPEQGPEPEPQTEQKSGQEKKR